MRIVYQNVAGLDVHKKVVVAAVRVLGPITRGRMPSGRLAP